MYIYIIFVYICYLLFLLAGFACYANVTHILLYENLYEVTTFESCELLWEWARTTRKVMNVKLYYSLHKWKKKYIFEVDLCVLQAQAFN